MMTFKDIIKQDAKDVFVNEDEFAEKHIIDGRELLVIVDGNELLEREKRQRALEKGTYAKQVLFFVPAIDFGRLPAIGKPMDFDGKRYFVADAIREGTMYSISLEAVKS